MDRQIIERKAKTLLKKYNFNKVPIDIESLAQKIGINVYKEILPDDISGILDLRNIPIIMINKEHHINRQRFSIAHELGHFFLNRPVGVHVDKQTYFRNSNSAKGLDEIEIDANRFAAEILMPTDLVENLLNKYSDLIDSNDDVIYELSKIFIVSTTSMSFKLINMGYFSDSL